MIDRETVLRQLKLEIRWEGAKYGLYLENRRSRSIFELSISLRQLLRRDNREERESTSVYYVDSYVIPEFGRARLTLPWEGQPSYLGVSYHRGDSVRISCVYTLPQAFLVSWSNAKKRKEAWSLATWDMAHGVGEAIKQQGLSLHLLAGFRGGIVLVLGHDTGVGLRRMRRIQRTLESLGYYGLLLKDMPDTEFGSKAMEEKLLTLAGLSEFCIIEDSAPAGQIDELSLLARARKTIAVLRIRDQGSTWMTSDYEVDFRNSVSFVYPPTELSRYVVKAVDWAENRIEQRDLDLRRIYPWR